MAHPSIIIVSPYLASANNGNWRTAQRWSHMLAGVARVRIVANWLDESADLMIALHARRSAASIVRWAEASNDRPLGVVLTGTDLHRDIDCDVAALHSLALANGLVVLHELGIDALPPEHRAKARVILQSTPSRRALPKTSEHLRVIMVGHLREEKSPRTLFAAARLISPDAGIRIDHVGDALDPDLATAATECMAACPHYRWLGGREHRDTRGRIQRAHVLVHASRMEGGAHVIMEAVQSGTPVIASRIPGNVGMLGADHAGYFEWNDAAQLATLLEACRNAQRGRDGLLLQLASQCARRASLFDPARERTLLRQWVFDLLETRQ